jgi:hypothetical protein
VLVLHKLVVNGIDKLAPLYNCFLTILCNLSPYAKSLCLLSAVKLVSLFELFTSPRFLYAAEGNHVYVQLLLETFNNVVRHSFLGFFFIFLLLWGLEASVYKIGTWIDRQI